MEDLAVSVSDAVEMWSRDREWFESMGVTLPNVRAYLPEALRHKSVGHAMDVMQSYGLALDALPALTTTPNSAVPAFLTTMMDPKVFKVLFSPNNATKILGEVRKGTWLDETIMFPTAEHTGEVSSYGDFNENGRTGVNTEWPQRQAYLFQTIKEYGDREVERAGLAKINWISEIDVASATVINKFANFAYFFGVQGLQNYGLLNDPALTAAISPGPKANGGVKWFSALGVLNATANEIYNDIQSLYFQLVIQSGGLIQQDSKLVLAMSPTSAVALTATNGFNVNVTDLLKKNFPNIRVETAVQYGQTSAVNTQGVSGGNLVQLFAEEVEGQEAGYCAFNEKMYAQPIVRQLSSYRQKVVGGVWGSVLRQPFCVSSMLGV